MIEKIADDLIGQMTEARLIDKEQVMMVPRVRP